jgi:hypothetical protein
LSCWKTWSKFRCCRKGRMIGISSLYFTACNVPWQFWAECHHHDKFQSRP